MESAQREVGDAAAVRSRLAAAAPKSAWGERLAAATVLARTLADSALRPAVLLPATFLAILAGGALVTVRRVRGGRRGYAKSARAAAAQAAARAGHAVSAAPDAVATSPRSRLPAVARRARPVPFDARAETGRDTSAGEATIWGRILRLAAEGVPGDEIARTLGASPDDVNLVLGLEKKRLELAGALAGARAAGRGALEASA
jgi:hypothetical protein